MHSLNLNRKPWNHLNVNRVMECYVERENLDHPIFSCPSCASVVINSFIKAIEYCFFSSFSKKVLLLRISMKIIFIFMELCQFVTATKLGLHATRNRSSQFADLPPQSMAILRKILKQQRCKLLGQRFC